MTTVQKLFKILIAEDDDHDFFFYEEAFRRGHIHVEWARTGDGIELLDYLRDPSNEKPALILLDLNMPKKDGRQVLKEIKADPELARIPVIVLSTSSAPGDVEKSYELGAAAYTVKPAGFEGLVRFAKGFAGFWFDCARLPYSQ